MDISNFNINITKVPHAILAFMMGTIATIVTWQFMPIIISSLDAMNIIGGSDALDIKYIAYFGLVIIAIITMLIYPMWILLEQDETE